jgi:hypothetical protein
MEVSDVRKSRKNSGYRPRVPRRRTLRSGKFQRQSRTGGGRRKGPPGAALLLARKSDDRQAGMSLADRRRERAAFDMQDGRRLAARCRRTCAITMLIGKVAIDLAVAVVLGGIIGVEWVSTRQGAGQDSTPA